MDAGLWAEQGDALSAAGRGTREQHEFWITPRLSDVVPAFSTDMRALEAGYMVDLAVRRPPGAAKTECPCHRGYDQLVTRRGMPVASSAEALRRMKRAKRRDTKPELAVRSELHRRGLRFFVDRAPLPGMRRRGDIVFPKARVAVYIDGCFWHGCPDHGTSPKANAAWWREKIAANQARDRDTDDKLRAAGWTPMRVWEHEPPIEAANRVAAVVQAAREQTR